MAKRVHGACTQLPAPAREVLEGGERTQISNKTRIQKLTKSTRTRKDAPTIANGKYNFKFKIKGCKFELQKRGQKQMAASGT